MASKKETKKIGIKNYILALLFLIGGIVLVLYIFEWYQVKQEEKVMNSYLLKTSTINYVIDSVDLYDEITQEAPNDYFVFIGFTGDKDEYENEKNLKAIIDDYNLNDITYYIDVTKEMETDGYIEKINSELGINIENVPAIIYFKDGKLAEDGVIYASENGVLSVNNFEKLLDIYEFEMSK